MRHIGDALTRRVMLADEGIDKLLGRRGLLPLQCCRQFDSRIAVFWVIVNGHSCRKVQDIEVARASGSLAHSVARVPLSRHRRELQIGRAERRERDIEIKRVDGGVDVDHMHRELETVIPTVHLDTVAGPKATNQVEPVFSP